MLQNGCWKLCAVLMVCERVCKFSRAANRFIFYNLKKKKQREVKKCVDFFFAPLGEQLNFFLLSFCNFPRRCVFGHWGEEEGGNSVAFPRRRKTMERRLVLLLLCVVCVCSLER